MGSGQEGRRGPRCDRKSIMRRRWQCPQCLWPGVMKSNNKLMNGRVRHAAGVGWGWGIVKGGGHPAWRYKVDSTPLWRHAVN